VTVRWFAAAGEAAGCPEDTFEIDATTTTAALLARAVEARGPRLGHVLAACSVLVGSVLDEDRSRVLTPGTTVDVLPPFAGG
jgi:molybdopterin converting factor small subunit